MLTPEIVIEAIATAHKTCSESESGCIHAEALAGAFTEIVQDVLKDVEIAAMDNSNVLMLLYNHALHVGWRMHELANATEAPKIAASDKAVVH